MDRKAWCAAIHGVAKSWIGMSDFHFHFHVANILTPNHKSACSSLLWDLTLYGTGLPGAPFLYDSSLDESDLVEAPCVSKLYSVLCLHAQLFLTLSRVWIFANSWTVGLQVLLSMGFYRQEHQSRLPCLSSGDLLNLGSNPDPPQCRWILYHLSHHWTPRILEWVAYPLSRGIFQPANQTRVSCNDGRFFASRTTREARHEDIVSSLEN